MADPLKMAKQYAAYNKLIRDRRKLSTLQKLLRIVIGKKDYPILPINAKLLT